MPRARYQAQASLDAKRDANSMHLKSAPLNQNPPISTLSRLTLQSLLESSTDPIRSPLRTPLISLPSLQQSPLPLPLLHHQPPQPQILHLQFPHLPLEPGHFIHHSLGGLLESHLPLLLLHAEARGSRGIAPAFVFFGCEAGAFFLVEDIQGGGGDGGGGVCSGEGAGFG